MRRPYRRKLHHSIRPDDRLSVGFFPGAKRNPRKPDCCTALPAAHGCQAVHQPHRGNLIGVHHRFSIVVSPPRRHESGRPYPACTPPEYGGSSTATLLIPPDDAPHRIVKPYPSTSHVAYEPSVQLGVGAATPCGPYNLERRIPFQHAWRYNQIRIPAGVIGMQRRLESRPQFLAEPSTRRLPPHHSWLQSKKNGGRPSTTPDIAVPLLSGSALAFQYLKTSRS